MGSPSSIRPAARIVLKFERGQRQLAADRHHRTEAMKPASIVPVAGKVLAFRQRDRLVDRRIEEPDDVSADVERMGDSHGTAQHPADALRHHRLAIAWRTIDEN